MTKRTSDTVITEALGHLDPAGESALTEAEQDRADAAFVRIVATPGDQATAALSNHPHRRRRRLLAALGLTGAVGVAVPVLLLGGSAYGSWTEKPEALTAAGADTAATTCRAALDVPDGGERVEVAERRGDWTYVLLSGSGTRAICLMPDALVGKDAADRGDFFGNYSTDAAAPPTLDPDRIDENSSMQGSTDEGWFIWTEGYVGSNVTGVSVQTSSGLDIEASVVGNRFAVWWPAAQQSSKRAAETWSYTVHLADGSTRSTAG